jgi:L-threonylcarbamoyladenylate synthase
VTDAERSTDAGRLQACLVGGGVAVIPTDTVYGLTCNPENEAAVTRLYELKRRPPRKPTAVMFFSLSAALEALSEIGPRTRVALRLLLPGPVTLLLPNPAGRFPLACEGGLLGLRVPRFAAGLGALSTVSVPAMQSSANLSGGLDPRRLEDVPDALREGADLVLDGGELPGTASTVVDLSGYERAAKWGVVREGPITHEHLERLLD